MKLPSETRHLCFDKDGTLIDVHAYWSYTAELRANEIQKAFALPPTAISRIYDAMGIDILTMKIKLRGPTGYYPRHVVIQATVDHLRIEGLNISPNQIAKLFAEVDQRQQAMNDYRIQILPGVRKFLEFIGHAGLTMSVFSSDRRENTDRILNYLEIDQHFSAIVGGGCVQKPKPHPEGFLVACARTGVPIYESVYVGDTVEDLKMALDAQSLGSIGVGTGLCELQELSKYTSHFCTQLDELIAD